MLPHLRSALFAAFSATTIAAIAACAESDDTPGAIEQDGGSQPQPSGDSGDTGDADAGDAAVRTCSDQGFCHAVVPPNETLRDVWGEGTTAWAVSEQGDVLRWDGQQWIVHTKKLGALYAIWGSGPTDIWIGGERGLYHGTGASSQAVVFEPVDAPGDPTIPILSIWGTGPDDIFAAGGHISDEDFLAHGRVLHHAGADPSTWDLEPISDEPYVFKRVWGSTAAGTWIAGDEGYDHAQVGVVFARAPGADELAPVTIDTAPPNGNEPGSVGSITAGGIMADGSVLVVGETASSTPTFWYGALVAGGTVTWSYEVRDQNDLALRAVWAIPGKETWIAGDYGRLRSRGTNGAKWMQAAMMVANFPVIEPLYGIWGTSTDDFWVVGRNTAIHRTPGKEQ